MGSVNLGSALKIILFLIVPLCATNWSDQVLEDQAIGGDSQQVAATNYLAEAMRRCWWWRPNADCTDKEFEQLLAPIEDVNAPASNSDRLVLLAAECVKADWVEVLWIRGAALHCTRPSTGRELEVWCHQTGPHRNRQLPYHEHDGVVDIIDSLRRGYYKRFLRGIRLGKGRDYFVGLKEEATQILSFVMANGISLMDSNGSHFVSMMSSGLTTCHILGEILLEWGVDPNKERDATGKTALHAAVTLLNGLPTVHMLMRYKANPRIRDQRGKRPDEYAKDPLVKKALLDRIRELDEQEDPHFPDLFAEP